MKTTLTRLFTVALLMMVSMGARAEIKIDLGGKDNKGVYEGGTVTAKQSEAKDGKVTVTLTFTPDKNYSITRKDVLLAYTAPTNTSGNTRVDNPTLGETFNPSGSDDVFAYPKSATYTVTVDANLGLSVQNVEFKNLRDSGAKAGGDDDPKPKGYDYSGTYYIANYNDGVYSSTDKTDNFYLCPASNYFDGDGEGKKKQPFLTTHTPDNNTEKETKPIFTEPIAKWEIEFATTGDDDVDYYYIKFLGSDNNEYYIVHNRQLVSNNKGRVRVHLQTTKDETEDNNLFFITQGTKGDKKNLNLCPKAGENVDNSGLRSSLNPAKANMDFYSGQNQSNPGSFKIDSKTIYCGGLVGYWTTDDKTGVWYLEDLITRPTISFNADNQIVITAQSGATLIYTTNGSKPTVSNGTAVNNNTVTFNPTDDETTIKAVAVVNGELSNISTFTIPVLPGSTHTFLLHSLGHTSATPYDGFFLQPGDVNNGNTTLTTSSMARPLMQWYLMSAGYDSEHQYYYFVNSETKDYLFCDAAGNVMMKTSTDFNAESDDYKFYFLTDDANGYRIVPKSRPTYWINKSKGHNDNAPVNTHNSVTDLSCRWNIIPVFDHKMPTELKPTPFTVSTSSSIVYYKIVNASATGYSIIPGTTNVTTSDSESADMAWYFEEAESDDWLTYYHIVNAVTGEYMYFNGNETSTGNNTAFIMSSLSTTDKDRYQFVVAKTHTSAIDGKYYIVPKVLKDLTYTNYSLVWRDVTNPLKTQAQRGDDNRKWTFATTTFACSEPVITYDEIQGTATITCSTPGAKIYYVRYTDGTGADPDLTDETIKATLTIYDGTSIDMEGYSYLKAIAARNDDGSDQSASVTEGPIDAFKCATPVIKMSGGKVTITCVTNSATIYYTLDQEIDTSDPLNTTGIQTYSVPFTVEGAPIIRAFAIRDGKLSNRSEVASYDKVFLKITKSSDILDNLSGFYYFDEGFVDDLSEPIGTNATPFTGTIDGGSHAFSIGHPLIGVAQDATIKNVILDNVTISGGTNVGAICNEATGDTRIYNCGVLATNSTVETDDDGYTEITSCSSTVSGSNYVGGIVGLLDGSSRVINCFSYANIIGGDKVGGIVGWNNVATNANSEDADHYLKTMVMNCMFYGDITGGSSKAPVYNGEIITNDGDNNGVNNFNYFWAGASYVQEKQIDEARYNCALSAETRFLQRFEFFRHLLNSNRALAAWWATGSGDNKDEMLKWVLEPSQIGSKTPYPILKPAYDGENNIIKYPSVVNIDAEHAEEFSGDEETAKTQYNQGRKFGTLTINIQNATSGAPTGANITTTTVYPNITDKDPVHFNFNYYKVQLPYYNDVGTKNYTDNKVVTGWKIVTISGGTHSFSDSGSDATATVDENGNISLTTPYNFADRKSTDKDNFDVSGRVFSQGAYFDVPEGVSSITIEPYWGKCVYVSDEYFDVVYQNGTGDGTGAGSPSDAMTTATNVTTVGGGSRFTNGAYYNINGSNQKVYTTMGEAVSALSPSGSVYDNAIVLVGNVHSLDLSNKTNSKPYTIMSIDLDKDNEPDYSYILRFNGRTRLHPVRVDFLNVIGLGVAQKSSGGTGTYNFGIMQPLGWFEVTNTGLFRVTQFEYDYDGRTNSPMILQGGVIEQWVTVGGAEEAITEAKTVSYYHIGGNVWFKEFHIGVHQDKTQVQFVSPHPPISVTGGDYDIFYLTGYYNSPDNNYDDNAECYINGGRFNKVAGTGMQGIGNRETHANGNITWQIDNADINEFYGGGINAAHIAEGNIMTIISNSRVDQFCGGPKFGDMNSGKKVVTNATNCTFRTFFGAGYGGNSYNRRYPKNQNNVTNINWNTWVQGNDGLKYRNSSDNTGVETRIDYQFIPMSNNTGNVARLFVDYVSFSFATTRNVTSKLTDCTITTRPLGTLELFEGSIGNFYGGGNLGKVDGPVNSTLTNCIVEGNVYGAGYSATLPQVGVMRQSFRTQPSYDLNLGAFLEARLPQTDPYKWEHADAVGINTGTKTLFTTENLEKSNLGSVNGNVNLTIGGDSKIGTDGDQTGNTGNVFGGGDESYVVGSANKVTVTLKGNANVLGNVFGGGDEGLVEGSTEVNIQK